MLIENFTSILLGLIIGIAVSVALTRLISSFLFGISAVDTIAFGVASTVLLLVGTVAALIPALRATRVNPVITLRGD